MSIFLKIRLLIVIYWLNLVPFSSDNWTWNGWTLIHLSPSLSFFTSNVQVSFLEASPDSDKELPCCASRTGQSWNLEGSPLSSSSWMKRLYPEEKNMFSGIRIQLRNFPVPGTLNPKWQKAEKFHQNVLRARACPERPHVGA